jgi:hypothetical protein
MASRKESLPENGVFEMLLALPAKGPEGCTVVFSVFTLVVVLGVGDCVAVTDPVCPPRPDSGSCVATVPCDGAAAGPNCAHAEAAPINRNANVLVIVLSILIGPNPVVSGIAKRSTTPEQR